MRHVRRWSCVRFGGLMVIAILVVTAVTATAQSTIPDGEWHAFGRDSANTKYSPLDQITAENFTDLEIAWRWGSLSQAVVDSNERIQPRRFVATSLMVDGLVYTVTALGQVAAVNAGTGEQVWDYDPRIYDYLERPPNMGWHHRGVSYWDDAESDDARIFIASHDLRLVALSARTGRMYADFGLDGYVDLGSDEGFDRAVDRSRMTYSSPVTIVGDTVIVGSIIQDTNLWTVDETTPGHVRAYDARTGDMKWVFRTIPQGDDFGADSWGNESWRYSGHSNVWSYMAADEELGHVYFATGTPSNDWYGGMRPGDNLFAESIVAVDVETGERVQPGEPLINIQAKDALQVVTWVNQAEVNQLMLGSEVTVRSEASPKVYQARVESIAQSAHPRTGNFEVKCRLVDADVLLRDGMTANVRIQVESNQQVIFIPRSAVVDRDRKPVIFVLHEGRAQQRAPRFGLPSGDRIPVLSGLEQDEPLIVEPLDLITDGIDVRAEDAS